MQRAESDFNAKQKDERIEKQLLAHTQSNCMINHNSPIQTAKPTHLHGLHNPTTNVCNCKHN